MPRPVLELLAELCARCRPPAVMLERDGNYPPAAELRDELDAIAAAPREEFVPYAGSPLRAGVGAPDTVPTMDLGLADRVYVLTGASRGLGYATAQALVADGARVVISSRDAGHVQSAAESLGGADNAVGVAADLADPETPSELVDSAMRRFGRLDGALISVGGPARGTAASMTDDQWRAAFETVFLGSVRAARTFAAALGDGGAVGLVLSTSARAPVGGLGLSNGLRPGLAMVAKDMADEYGPRGVRIVSLLPGRLLTDRNRELFAATGDAAAAAAEAAGAIPLGRLGEPAEFGRVAAFLLSPAASYLTGIAVPVDGGSLRSV